MARLYTVQSCSPSAPTSVSPQAARGNSPCPRLACLQIKDKGKRRKRKFSALHHDCIRFPLPPAVKSYPTPPGSSTFGPVRLPTSVVRRKSRIGRVHRSSANRSRIVKRFLPLPVARRTSAHSVFCCHFHRGQFLKRCSRVCALQGHHPHSAVARLFDHTRYCPVRQCPTFNWWNRFASLLGPWSTALFCRSAGILYFLGVMPRRTRRRQEKETSDSAGGAAGKTMAREINKPYNERRGVQDVGKRKK
jgi:hypothetical protein